jgi:hypothetical protein
VDTIYAVIVEKLCDVNDLTGKLASEAKLAFGAENTVFQGLGPLLEIKKGA